MIGGLYLCFGINLRFWTNHLIGIIYTHRTSVVIMFLVYFQCLASFRIFLMILLLLQFIFRLYRLTQLSRLMINKFIYLENSQFIYLVINLLPRIIIFNRAHFNLYDRIDPFVIILHLSLLTN
jgi:hypothetical protein